MKTLIKNILLTSIMISLFFCHMDLSFSLMNEADDLLLMIGAFMLPLALIYPLLYYKLLTKK